MNLSTGIHSVIKQFEYPVFHVHLREEQCTCVNYDTKEPDPTCKRCIGTGKRVKIRKVKAASQEPLIKGQIRARDKLTLDRVFYIRAQYDIGEDDIIVDTDGNYIVFEKQTERDFKGEVSYYRCLCSLKKQFNKEFLKSFKEIVGDK